MKWFMRVTDDGVGMHVGILPAIRLARLHSDAVGHGRAVLQSTSRLGRRWWSATSLLARPLAEGWRAIWVASCLKVSSIGREKSAPNDGRVGRPPERRRPSDRLGLTSSGRSGDAGRARRRLRQTSPARLGHGARDGFADRAILPITAESTPSVATLASFE